MRPIRFLALVAAITVAACAAPTRPDVDETVPAAGGQDLAPVMTVYKSPT